MSPLSPERWLELSPYLDRALDLAAEDREAWVLSLETIDADLVAHLRALLSDYDDLQESTFLEGAAQPASAAPDLSLTGLQLGAYRVVSNIGNGGMGSVWLAERSDGRFAGHAAIKLLNMALVGRAGQERFQREGNILARLSHPHIARLFDAGVSPTGQPYLVLEHVKGLPIDRYCDEQGLDVDGRLRLFLDVLEAVEHAHANLIVHRDIKPPNVLVTDDGQVKLLDFGIAKLLEGDALSGEPIPGEESNLTREAGAALTPAFAAPEQMTGGVVTTATDVYALGVLLYVLLSGRHPAGDNFRSTAVLVQAIVDTQPRKVSETVTAANGVPDAPIRYAASRGTTPQKLRRRLQGDLDVIVAKALKKSTSERYASVTALADDVRRSLNSVPISARPDTLWYRSSSFVRRHRAGVAATAAMVLLIGGLTAFYTTRLATERDRARLEAEKAAKVSGLLTGLLTGADPYTTRETRGEPTVRALLDAGAARMQKELEGQPELQAEILTVIGRVYQRLGLFDKAQPLLERSLAAGRQSPGDHVRVAQSLNDLGVLLRDRNERTAAVAALEESLAMRRRLLGEEHIDVAVTEVELGRAYVDQGMGERAEPLFRASLVTRRKLLGEWHRNTATSMSDLGMLLLRRGDTAGAEPVLRQCLTITRMALAEDHPDVATAMSNVASIEQEHGNHAAALALLNEAVAIYRKSLGNHWRLASSLDKLASSLREQKKYGEAAAALDEGLAVARSTRGDDHPLTAALLVGRARLHFARGEASAADPLLRRALEIYRRAYMGDDWRVATTESLLGESLIAQRQYPDAEALLLHAHGVLKDARGRSAREGPRTLTRLVTLYEAWGQPEKAAPYRNGKWEMGNGK